MEQEMCNQKQNSDKTKENQRNHHKKLKTHQKKSNSKNNSKKQNNQIEMLTKPTKKKKQVFPKHSTNLETLKLSFTKKISSIQNYTKP
jgi:hypothetical protein